MEIILLSWMNIQYNFKFKIDLIVWKLELIGVNHQLIKLFKIDLIVWKSPTYILKYVPFGGLK